MRPTVDDQLEGADRLLEGVAGDPGLSAGSRELLSNARRLVRRAQRASSGWTFLADDAGRMQALLADLAPRLPGLDPEIRAATTRDVPVVGDLDALAGQHEALRGLLARAVRALPDDEPGQAARARVAGYLRERVDIDPT